MKHLKKLIIAIVVIAVASVGFTWLLHSMKLSQSFMIEQTPLSISYESETIAEGKKLFEKNKCANCHGERLEGKVFIDSPLEGVFAGNNLTTGDGGIGRDYTNDDMAKAIRHGVKQDGKPILYMPSDVYYNLDDFEVGALIAYIRSVPPVNNKVPNSYAGIYSIMQGVMGNLDILLTAGKMDHKKERISNVKPEPTVAFGRKVANQCVMCHSANFSGGNRPGFPVQPSNLTPNKQDGLGDWTKEQFITAMTTGMRPDGRVLNQFMPWAQYANMSKIELEALWLFLQSIPAKETGDKN